MNNYDEFKVFRNNALANWLTMLIILILTGGYTFYRLINDNKREFGVDIEIYIIFSLTIICTSLLYILFYNVSILIVLSIILSLVTLFMNIFFSF